MGFIVFYRYHTDTVSAVKNIFPDGLFDTPPYSQRRVFFAKKFYRGLNHGIQ